MKITSVQTYKLRYPLSRTLGGSHYDYRERDFLLIKITTDDGLVGWGETALLGGVRSLIRDTLGPQLIGQDPRQHRRLWLRMWGPNFGNGMAVGGLDIALEDLRGKATGQSIAELHGGRLRDKLPVYASSLNYTEGIDPLESYPADARKLIDQGFRAMKLRLGRLPLRQDMAIAAAVREAVGPDVRLTADGNGGYTLGSAMVMGNELARLGFYWFEEPLPEAHYAGYEVLREKLPIALAGGEVLDSRGYAKGLLERRAVDIIQPDVTLCGGVTECLFVAEMAALYGVPTMPHCYGGPIAVAATVQVLSLLADPNLSYTPDTPMLELDVSESPLTERLLKRPLKVIDGQMDVPTGPGLGIEVDEAVVREFCVD
jgi:D-galactarolactone cycloisomerase